MRFLAVTREGEPLLARLADIEGSKDVFVFFETEHLRLFVIPSSQARFRWHMTREAVVDLETLKTVESPISFKPGIASPEPVHLFFDDVSNVFVMTDDSDERAALAVALVVRIAERLGWLR